LFSSNKERERREWREKGEGKKREREEKRV
jgi:hypothetical protein